MYHLARMGGGGSCSSIGSHGGVVVVVGQGTASTLGVIQQRVGRGMGY